MLILQRKLQRLMGNPPIMANQQGEYPRKSNFTHSKCPKCGGLLPDFLDRFSCSMHVIIFRYTCQCTGQMKEIWIWLINWSLTPYWQYFSYLTAQFEYKISENSYSNLFRRIWSRILFLWKFESIRNLKIPRRVVGPDLRITLPDPFL